MKYELGPTVLIKGLGELINTYKTYITKNGAMFTFGYGNTPAQSIAKALRKIRKLTQ